MKRRERKRTLGIGAAVAMAFLALSSVAVAQEEEKRDGSAEGVSVRSRVVFVDEQGRIVEWSDRSGGEGVRDRSVGPEAARPEVIFFSEPDSHHELLLELLGGHGYIGVQSTALSPELRRYFGVPDDAGVLISRVESGAPAEAAGILVGDIVTRVEGAPVVDVAALGRTVRPRQDGEPIELELYRDGRRQTVTVNVAERRREAVRVRAGGDRTYELVTRKEALEHGSDPSVASEDALRKVYEYFASEEWRQTLEGYEGRDWSEIEMRMREVEKRLGELEGELDQPRSSPPP